MYARIIITITDFTTTAFIVFLAFVEADNRNISCKSFFESFSENFQRKRFLV